jgi:hypothetical protein
MMRGGWREQTEIEITIEMEECMNEKGSRKRFERKWV